jgi:hypothetical protein
VLHLYDARTQVLTDLAPTRGRQVRLRVNGPLASADDLRRYLVADLIRRTAQLHRLAVSVDSDADGLAALNIYPPGHDAPVGDGADVWVVGAEAEPADGHWVVPGRTTAGAAELGDPLAALAEQVLDPLALRLAFLEHHYRQPLDLTWDELNRADETLRGWRALVAVWATHPSKPMCAQYVAELTGGFDDDLDTPAALGSLRTLADDAEIPPGSKFETAAYIDQLLGLDVVSQVGRAG